MTWRSDVLCRLKLLQGSASCHEFVLRLSMQFSVCDSFQKVTAQTLPGFDHVVWTHSMMRMAVMVGLAMQFGEPVLLVGDTGFVLL